MTTPSCTHNPNMDNHPVVVDVPNGSGITGPKAQPHQYSADDGRTQTRPHAVHPDIMKFFFEIGKLKRTPRTGWVYRDVPEPESVSDHMYRMAIMTMFLDGGGTNPPINTLHCMQLALCHDMAECIVGDLTPEDNVSKEDKHKREEEAMEELRKLAGEPIGSRLCELWKEYESQTTPEAKVVKDIDRFEMICQAFEYEEMLGQPNKLEEFFDSTKGLFNNSQIKQWVQFLNEKRSVDKSVDKSAIS